jgi:hypothetical protein
MSFKLSKICNVSKIHLINNKKKIKKFIKRKVVKDTAFVFQFLRDIYFLLQKIYG